MGGEARQESAADGEAVLTGAAPVSELQGYAAELAAYTRGRGRLFCTLDGYRPCHNAEAVITAIRYDPERDADNPPDSVFCSHGAGTVVKWDEADRHMHVASPLRMTPPPAALETPRTPSPARSAYTGTPEEDQELLAIFERTYGPVKRQAFTPPRPPRRPTAEETAKRAVRTQFTGPEYLLVDGYNIIFAWDVLKETARENLDAARKQSMADRLSSCLSGQNPEGGRKTVETTEKLPSAAG